MQDVHVKLHPKLSWQKQPSTKNKALFTAKLDLNLRKKLVNCYIWSITLYGAEIWTLWEVDQKYLKSVEIRCCRRTKKFSWSDRVRTGNLLQRIKEAKNILQKRKKES